MLANGDGAVSPASSVDDVGIAKDGAARRLLLPRNKSVLLSLKQTFIADFPHSGAEDSKSAVSTPTDQGGVGGGVEETNFGGTKMSTTTVPK